MGGGVVVQQVLSAGGASRDGHFEEAENVGDCVALARLPAVDPHAKEEQRVQEGAGEEEEVVDEKHGDHG